jgi:hypothetical protein
MAEPHASALVIELVAPDGAVTPAEDAADFALRLASRPIEGIAHGEEHELTIAYHGARPVERGLRISVDLPPASEAPTWLVPGLVYGENRPVECRTRFPRYERGADDPADMTSERWSFRADRCATPVVFGWSGGRMAAVAVDEVTALGLSGIGFIGSADRVRVWVDLPYREEPVRYVGGSDPAPSEARTHLWRPGEANTIRVLTGGGDGDRHGYVSFLRALHRRAAPATALEPWVSVEDAAALAADGLLRWHYHPEHRALYETAAFERDLDGRPEGEGDRAAMHTGWVSGAPWAAQLLAWGRRTGSDAHAAAGIAVLDHIAENLAQCGSFWSAWALEGGWGTGWTPAGTIHANTIGQATLFYLRALAAERRHGIEHPTWEAGVESNLDALLARQRDDGNLGLHHDADSNAVTEWRGAGGLIWIAALLAGSDWFGDPAYREAAIKAGVYYGRFVDDERIYGAPEDVHLAPTSEDGVNAVVACVALHRATGDAAWLDVARRSADWLLTFRYSYDVAFEPESFLGAYGFRTRGTDQASVANQHLHHFGLLAHPELVELSRLTGDPHYSERAHEALAAWRQMIARRDGDLNGRRGMVSERFHQTDWVRPKGSILPLSHAWSAGVLLFACLAALDEER